MAVTFAVLASGSRGNVALVRSSGANLLIDLGLSPRTLGRRLEAAGASLDSVAAVLLTHTHGDHVREATLLSMARRGVTLLCDEGHVPHLRRFGGFRLLETSGRVRCYDDRPFLTPTGARVEAIPLSHDGGPTFGFRLECKTARRGRPATIGFLSDTGTWWDQTAEALTDADLIALEFNHDVELQRGSIRSPFLIERNLGDQGHLSNVQGAELLAEVLRRSRPGAVRHAVLLHLSQECNRPEIALGAARAAVRHLGRRVTLHAASQDVVRPVITLRPGRVRVGALVPTVPGFPWESV